MCDTHIPEIGYLCYECKSEFAEYVKSKNLDPYLTKSALIQEMKLFVETNKGSYVDGVEEKISIDEFFKKHS